MRGEPPEVWDQARMHWPDRPEIQGAWVEACVAIEDAFRAVNQLPHGDPGPDRVHPLAAVQANLAAALTGLRDWARHPLAWPNGLD